MSTHNCHMCSTFHCNLHVSRHFDELHKIDLRKNELQWLLFAAWDKTLGIPCILLLKSNALGKLVTEKPVDFVGFDNVVEFNKNRQNDDNVVKAYKS